MMTNDAGEVAETEIEPVRIEVILGQLQTEQLEDCHESLLFCELVVVLQSLLRNRARDR